MPNLAVNSGPGTGKTYTATGICRYLRATNREVFLKNNKHTDEQLAIWEWVDQNIKLPDNPKIIYAAYNKDNIPGIEKKVPATVECKTIHGLGYKILQSGGYIRVNNNRSIQIVEKITGQHFNSMKDKFTWLGSIKFLAHLKDELLEINQSNLELMKSKYDDLATFEIHKNMVQQCNQLVVEMKKIDRTIGVEFIDQVWLAIFKCTTPIFDLGIIDECQDLSASRLMLVQRACKNLVFVGDRDQAINAFAGADPHAFDKIIQVCDKELLLKCSFRNPPNIVKRCNQIKPNARLRGLDKPEGREVRVNFEDITSYLPENPGDAMVICRYNAPLISCALKLMKARIPCTILGNNLVDQLCNIVKGRKAIDLDDLGRKLAAYEDYACRDVKPHIQEIIQDKIECIRSVINVCESVDEVEPTLKQMFKVPKNVSHVELSTIHKAKGKERPHVFVLFPPIKSPRAITPEQITQEENLEFVAWSRTSKDIYFVFRDE